MIHTTVCSSRATLFDDDWAQCQDCKQEWNRLEGGKWVPVDKNGRPNAPEKKWKRK